MKTTQLNIGGRVPNISPLNFLKGCIQFNFIIAHTSNEEILDTINVLEHKSTGPSSIPFKLLSLISDLIIMPLHMLFRSFSTGVFPKLMKIKVDPHRMLITSSNIFTFYF